MVAGSGFRAALWVGATWLALAADAQAQGRSIALESLDQRITVLEDAAIDVVETLRIQFTGAWNGIERDYWLEHETAAGRNTRLRMEVRSVTDGEGAPLRVEEEGIAQGRRLRIWVPGANDATRTVIVHYRIPDVIRFFDEDDPGGARDELYWDVTGNVWEMPIGRASATVSLPAGATNTEAWAYTGRAGSSGQDATIEWTGTEARFVTTRGLSPYEGLTVSVSLAPGLIQRPGAIDRLRETIARFWPLVLPFMAFFGMYRVWDRHGRDPAPRSVTVQYEPPEGLTAVEAGTLVDHAAEMHDITSMLVDLAVRGYLTIEERTEKKLLVFSDTEYWFHARRPRPDWSELAAHEQRLLSALFAQPTETRDGLPSVRLKDLENRFYQHVGGIRTAVYESLIERGMYRHRPDQARARWLLFAAVWIFIGIGGVAFLSGRPWIGDPLVFGIATGLCMLIVGAFALLMPSRTEKGARTQEAALGFKEFLARVEQDRYRRMITSPAQFERYLSYALAFDVADRWAKAFEDLYRTPPDWYRGSYDGAFRATHLTRSMNAMSMAAGRTMTSSPQSSSSGSGGGGFSGGGSGGGGGRGF